MTIGWASSAQGDHPDLKVVPAMKGAENTKVAAVYSRDIGAAEAFARSMEFLKPTTHSTVYFPILESTRSMLPRQTSYTLRIRSSSGVRKHILVEKPMATHVSEAVDMIRTCRARGVKLGVGYQLRHHPGHKKAQSLIEKGTLGITSMAQAQWCIGARGVVDPPPRTGRSEWWEDLK